MATVTASDARTRFGKLLERVAQGEEIVITRHDIAVARIVPAERRDLAKVQAAVDGIRELRAAIAARRRGSKPITDRTIKQLIAEGRR
jgi:prevent-host-death family protein